MKAYLSQLVISAIFWIVSGTVLQAQDMFQVKIIDAVSGDALPHASVVLPDGRGVVADTRGMVVLPVTLDSLLVTVHFLGYEPFTGIAFRQSPPFVIRLQPVPIQAEEVVITGEAPDGVEAVQTGVQRLKVEEMNALPVFMGETDILKTVQLLPGVQAGSEGNTGFFVRGGSVDQNLILLDGIPIYNPSHLFGFFSMFNPYSIRELELTKSGFPARYGGRVSSVLDIKTIRPDMENYRYRATVGLVAASASVEGPLLKGKAAQHLAVRRTYIDLLAKAVFPDDSQIRNQTNYYFGDVNYKLDFNLSAKDRITATAYHGVDEFNYVGKNNFINKTRWTNSLAGLEWGRVFNRSLSQHTSVYWSSYRINFGAGLNNYSLDIFSEIQDLGLKNDWYYEEILPGHNLSFGVQGAYHRFTPNNFDIRVSDEPISEGPNEQLFGWTGSAYLEDDFSLSDRLAGRIGFRYNFYRQVGPFTRYMSDENHQLTDSVSYAANEKVVQYNTWEPRIALRYKLGAAAALKASLDFSSQFVHLAPISSVSLPTDIWVPGSQLIRPQKAVQYALEYARNVGENVEVSAGAYFKNMKNLVEYRNGVVLGYGTGYNYDDNFVFGDSESYGAEFFIKKSSGMTTGWISYTLSKTTRYFEELNQGRAFPAKYDRRHDLSLTLNHELSERWAVSGVFVLATGNALTMPVGRYVIEGNVINDYGGRNNFRMPAYHRADLSVTYKSKPGTKWKSEWVLSVYNAYNRQNPYYIYFDIRGDLDEFQLEIEPVTVALFPILPSLSYKISL